ncbi:hypothetical protein J2Y38_002567 [Flavobacterium sp. 2755]|uniref:hypothetical protein n=1 Tax=Flavobacterium sp. 2755 TaxID=2817765 RepID=UPI0028615932|nr:hypothetical protein [Flavobacterium sp. 2755]MDR6762356.1 hypothetical protein [Flavobacterium sp. 2755]
MKVLYSILLCMFFCASQGQNEKSLDETKSYIVKMINNYGWEQNSSKRRLRVDFEGDFLKIITMNKDFDKSLDDGSIYNFTVVYRFKGPIKEPGDIARIIIWADFLLNEKNNKWKKEALDIDIHNYEIGEQLMLAFKHLNKLLLEKKPSVEKF